MITQKLFPWSLVNCLNKWSVDAKQHHPQHKLSVDIFATSSQLHSQGTNCLFCFSTFLTSFKQDCCVVPVFNNKTKWMMRQWFNLDIKTCITWSTNNKSWAQQCFLTLLHITVHAEVWSLSLQRCFAHKKLSIVVIHSCSFSDPTNNGSVNHHAQLTKPAFFLDSQFPAFITLQQSHNIIQVCQIQEWHDAKFWRACRMLIFVWCHVEFSGWQWQWLLAAGSSATNDVSPGHHCLHHQMSSVDWQQLMKTDEESSYQMIINSKNKVTFPLKWGVQSVGFSLTPPVTWQWPMTMINQFHQCWQQWLMISLMMMTMKHCQPLIESVWLVFASAWVLPANLALTQVFLNFKFSWWSTPNSNCLFADKISAATSILMRDVIHWDKVGALDVPPSLLLWMPQQAWTFVSCPLHSILVINCNGAWCSSSETTLFLLLDLN